MAADKVVNGIMPLRQNVRQLNVHYFTCNGDFIAVNFRDK
jgi:hypothetical protein